MIKENNLCKEMTQKPIIFRLDKYPLEYYVTVMVKEGHT